MVIDLDDVNKQLNLRLESIRTHCESLGYKSDIGPMDMTAMEHASKITEDCKANLESSGRLITLDLCMNAVWLDLSNPTP